MIWVDAAVAGAAAVMIAVTLGVLRRERGQHLTREEALELERQARAEASGPLRIIRGVVIERR